MLLILLWLFVSINDWSKVLSYWYAIKAFLMKISTVSVWIY
jgi:hypothetical protein